MDIKDFNEIERSYQSAKTNRVLGACISCVGLIGLFASFLWGVSNPVVMGILLGGGLVFCAVCHDKVSKAIRALDMECYSKFGKPYSQSQREIFNEKYPNSGA